MARHLKNPRNIPLIYERLRLRIKYGVMKEPPEFEVLRRYPPLPPPLKRKPRPENITLPTDELEKAYRRRCKKAGRHEPAVPAMRPDRDPARWFAFRQWEIMSEDPLLDEEAAVKQVEAELFQKLLDLSAKILGVARDFAKYHLEGPQGSTLDYPPELDMSSTLAWKNLQRQLHEEPWHDWDDRRKTHLDGWLVASVLRWDWNEERLMDEAVARAKVRGTTFKDEAGQAQVALAKSLEKLRCAVFFPHVSPSLRSAESLAKGLAEGVESDTLDAPDISMFESAETAAARQWTTELSAKEREGVQAPFADGVFDLLQQRAELRALEDWTDPEVDELNGWVTTWVMSGEIQMLTSDEKPDDYQIPSTLARAILEVFPELCPTYDRARKGPEQALLAQRGLQNELGVIPRNILPPPAPTVDVAELDARVPREKRFSPGMAIERVQMFREPEEIAKEMFRMGLFPDHLDAAAQENLDRLIREVGVDEDQEVDALIKERQDGSYSSLRVKAFNRAVEEREMLNRIHYREEIEGPKKQDMTAYDLGKK
ncbi:hypothetical protein M885DRAFT_529156 [Pelagophyceae sp. CCMP2097]|nr:hypothetical protein M885DRAFT_529156 [Pelagophyceae sp. CCMP2097]|mmetsp:Transcript_32772/g.110415  ORF Transcript_32772/g.110415 Transcript_32772/m.110415 type:complete len:542 (-) Transcript_32772:115-1740(-)